jgi:hypothetical protein
MAHYLSDDCEHLGSVRQARGRIDSYRFGRRRERYSRGRSALRGATSYLNALIQSIADAKFRRMLRELELRGTRLDVCEEWQTADAPLNRETAK